MSEPARRIQIVGAGPAGAAAAIAARSQGAPVLLLEKSFFPRNKVCGEFLSPEILAIVEKLGAGKVFWEARPARIVRARFCFGLKEKTWALPNTAFGLSRYALDALLLDTSLSAGAVLSRQTAPFPPAPTIVAHGRKGCAPKGKRLFGFKAHFSGPANDCVELFFFGGCYVGVSAIENGKTNVCGLAPEQLLVSHEFQIDDVLERCAALSDRIRPLNRTMEWLITGPLLMGNKLGTKPQEGAYFCGDALGFVDPFTGSGITAALITGHMAGLAASRGMPGEDYMRECRAALLRQYRVTSLLRAAIQSGWAERLSQFLPGQLLFQLTRIRAASSGS